jgi:hypothetical protein
LRKPWARDPTRWGHEVGPPRYPLHGPTRAAPLAGRRSGLCSRSSRPWSGRCCPRSSRGRAK